MEKSKDGIHFSKTGAFGISVTPTPVTGRRFNISFNNMAAGDYSLLFTDASGQQVYKTIIKNAGGDNCQQRQRY